jgi:hypothetical protein
VTNAVAYYTVALINSVKKTYSIGLQKATIIYIVTKTVNIVSGAVTLGITTFSITILSIKALDATFSITTFSVTTLSIKILSITTLP